MAFETVTFFFFFQDVSEKCQGRTGKQTALCCQVSPFLTLSQMSKKKKKLLLTHPYSPKIIKEWHTGQEFDSDD